MKRENNSGIEVLRIISILHIIVYYFAVNRLVYTEVFNHNNSYIINAFAISGKLGVYIFCIDFWLLSNRT